MAQLRILLRAYNDTKQSKIAVSLPTDRQRVPLHGSVEYLSRYTRKHLPLPPLRSCKPSSGTWNQSRTPFGFTECSASRHCGACDRPMLSEIYEWFTRFDSTGEGRQAVGRSSLTNLADPAVRRFLNRVKQLLHVGFNTHTSILAGTETVDG
jgi:hypothetical protein